MFVSYGAVLVFGLGVATQLALSLSRDFHKSDLLKLFQALSISLILSILIYLKLTSELKYPLSLLVIIYFLIATPAVAFSFIRRILPQINELVILIWSLGFWSLYFNRHELENPITAVLAVFTILVLIVSLLNIPVHRYIKLVLYMWFMIISVWIVFMLHQSHESGQYFSFNSPPDVYLFFLGMTFFYTASYLFYLLYFIPLPPSKKYSFADESRRIEEHARIIMSKYSSKQYHPLLIIFILLGIGFWIHINAVYGLVNEHLLLTIILALSPSLGEKLDSIYNSRD